MMEKQLGYFKSKDKVNNDTQNNMGNNNYNFDKSDEHGIHYKQNQKEC